MTLSFGVRTDVGRMRELNEDSYLIEGPLFVVADGMGGHQAGDVASATAVKTIADGADALSADDPDSLARLIANANSAVWTKAQSDNALRGMGTTCTVMLAEDDRVHLAHVGDSRAYLLSDGELSQLTEDHTLVGRMVREGALRPEDAQHHPQRNVITRALGIDSEVEVDLRDIRVKPADRLLLCSDGLPSMVTDAVIGSTLREHDDPQEAADELVRLALEAGGEDNITVVVVDFASEEDRAEPASAVRRDTSPGPVEVGGKGARAGGRRWLAGVIAVIVVLAVGYAVAEWTLGHSFYVGVDGSGRVAIFRGIPEKVGGLTLGEPLKATRLNIDDLPRSRWAALRRGMKVDSLSEAHATVTNLTDLAREFERAKGDSKA